MSHQRTAEHVTLECPPYKDIKHDFQDFLQSYNSFQGLLTRTKMALGMLFLQLLIQRTILMENPKSSFQLLV